jgi:hypothetical protein
VKPPDVTLVVDAWLRSVAPLPASCIGPTLPAARTTPAPAWVTQGFLQHTSVGGAPDKDVPLRRSVVQVDAWAVSLDTRAVPWGRASALLEAVLDACWDDTTQQTTLTVPDGYSPPVLRTVRALGEPVRVPSDDAGFARFRADLELVWTRPSTRG